MADLDDLGEVAELREAVIERRRLRGGRRRNVRDEYIRPIVDAQVRPPRLLSPPPLRPPRLRSLPAGCPGCGALLFCWGWPAAPRRRPAFLSTAGP